MSEPDWPLLIVSMIKAKERLTAVDGGLWPYTFPKVRASEEQVRSVEERLGLRLPSSYRTFLLHANGWPAFSQTIDLLGCADLLGGPYQDYLRTIFSALTEEIWKSWELSPDQILVIGVTTEDRDLLVLDLSCSDAREKPVVWLAGEKIDEWPSFTECFKSMIAYTHREAAQYESELK
jgi:hypothetical protein